MKSISKFLGAAALAAALVPAAFATTATGPSALEGAQPGHQHRYAQVGRDRTWVHLDRTRAPAKSSDARLMGGVLAAPAGSFNKDPIGGRN